MTISRDDFTEFFARVNDDHKPFRWQVRLLDHLLDRHGWPENISAPTGSGKSNVVDVHVFANALAAAGTGPRVPKRLSVVVNRRALVDQHLVRAHRLHERLQRPRDPLLQEIADLLTVDGAMSPLQVVSIRGGVPNDRSWLDDPRRCAVIAATPDMWGSRILFSGYGSTRHAWPREAGFLAYDDVLVLDEAHLNRQLLDTALSVSRMTAEYSVGEVPSLQVVATTATPGHAEGSVVRVEQSDMDIEPEGPLARRLTRRKLVRTIFELSERASADTRAAVIVREAAAMRTRLSDNGVESARHTVLCVANNVATAVSVADRLRGMVGADRVVTWVGPMRPMDLDEAKEKHPGLFDTTGAPEVEFLVATQTVEVGVDIDCAGLVTELAPGTSLAQRFGRVNRLGRMDSAEVVVVGPADQPNGDINDGTIYHTDDLAAAYTWLRDLGDGADVCPWNLAAGSVPERTLTRQLCELTAADVRWLANTSADDFWPVELGFFLRDDLRLEAAPVQVVVRRSLPDDTPAAHALLRVTPVMPGEVYPVRIELAREVLKRVLTSQVNPRAFVWRDDDLITVQAGGAAADAPSPDIRPGDSIVVDADHPLTTAGVISWIEPKRPEPLAAKWDPDHATDEGIVEVLRSPDEPTRESSQSARLRLANDLLTESPDLSTAEVADALDIGEQHELFLPPPGMRVDGMLPWLVVVPRAVAADDAEARQEWSPSKGMVSLEQHQSAVAARAREMAVVIGLGEFASEMDLAGAHHDDGKADARFQRGALGARGRPLMAKSRLRSKQQVQRDKQRGGLPTGWRHEQLSVAYVMSRLQPGPERDLVARLAGTSHGRGRPFFPYGPGTMRPPGVDDVGLDHAIDHLYATGAGWDEVLQATEHRFGQWGCAFLEAVFRAADCQVSKEGS